MAQALYPPYRAIGYSYTLSLFGFPGIAPYRAIPPIQTPIALTFPCMQSKIRGVSQVKLPSEGYRAIGGYSSYSIAVSRYTAPLSALEGQFLREISVRFAGENHLRTQKNTKQSSAQRFLNDPFPKTPFLQLLTKGSAAQTR